MASLNISFNIPQNPAFRTEEFRKQVTDYANKLIVMLSTSQNNEDSTCHRVLAKEELTSEMQDILKLAAPMQGKVPEWDLDGEIARQEALKQD